jgi:hypothetical protein
MTVLMTSSRLTSAILLFLLWDYFFSGPPLGIKRPTISALDHEVHTSVHLTSMNVFIFLKFLKSSILLKYFLFLCSLTLDT